MNAPPTTFRPLTSEVVRTAFSLLDRLDSQSPLKPPSLLRVFRLYCVQEMTVAQVARACRCSVGTVCNRLKLLHSKTGANPRRLRRTSAYLDYGQPPSSAFMLPDDGSDRPSEDEN